jgi:hypothetical protein
MEYNSAILFSTLDKSSNHSIVVLYIESRYCGELRHISLIVNNPRNVLSFNL